MFTFLSVHDVRGIVMETKHHMVSSEDVLLLSCEDEQTVLTGVLPVENKRAES